jgi:two-component system cell cycle sensor histidine kinase/response regulator CckA
VSLATTPSTSTEKLKALRFQVFARVAGCLSHAASCLSLETGILGSVTPEGQLCIEAVAGDRTSYPVAKVDPAFSGLIAHMRPKGSLWSRDLSRESWAQGKTPEGVRACVAHSFRADDQRYLLLVFASKARRRGFSDLDEKILDVLDTALRALMGRLRTQGQLMRSEERFRRFFHLSPVGAAMIRPDGRWDTVNDELVRLLDAGRVRLLGLTWAALTHPDDRAAEQILFDQVVAGRREGYRLEKRFVTPEGRHVPSKVVVRALRRSDGSTDRILALIEDLTQRQAAADAQEQLQLQLLQAQKLESLGVMAGGIAHDFNNLLTGVIGNGHLLRLELDLESEHPAQASLSALLGAATRASALIQQLLAYSGQGSISRTRLDLSVEVQGMSELLDSLTSKKVALRLDLGVGLPTVLADASQVQQVVMNLVLNGAEACGEVNGTVWIRTGREFVDPLGPAAAWVVAPSEGGACVWIEIEDTGCGLDANQLRRVFDPFYTTKKSGHGLGLASVLGIARAHGGALSVSTTLGRGSVFRVYFPEGADESGEVPALGQLAPEPGPVRSKVLVVDDAELVRTMCRKALERHGFEVLVAGGGSEAVALYRRLHSSLDAVVLDMMMPDMDGLEVNQALREIDASVPVLFISGNSATDMRERLANVECVGFLSKPFGPSELAQRVEQAIATQRP